MPALWTLKMESFRNVGGCHYYVMLRAPGNNRLHVNMILSVDEAAELARLDDWPNWKPGMWTERFPEKRDAIAAAVCAWHALKRDGDALVAAFSELTGNVDTLYGGPSGFMDAGLRLLEERQKRGTHMEWAALLEQYDLTYSEIVDTRTKFEDPVMRRVDTDKWVLVQNPERPT